MALTWFLLVYKNTLVVCHLSGCFVRTSRSKAAYFIGKTSETLQKGVSEETRNCRRRNGVFRLPPIWRMVSKLIQLRSKTNDFVWKFRKLELDLAVWENRERQTAEDFGDGKSTLSCTILESFVAGPLSGNSRKIHKLELDLALKILNRARRAIWKTQERRLRIFGLERAHFFVPSRKVSCLGHSSGIVQLKLELREVKNHNGNHASRVCCWQTCQRHKFVVSFCIALLKTSNAQQCRQQIDFS